MKLRKKTVSILVVVGLTLSFFVACTGCEKTRHAVRVKTEDINHELRIADENARHIGAEAQEDARHAAREQR